MEQSTTTTTATRDLLREVSAGIEKMPVPTKGATAMLARIDRAMAGADAYANESDAAPGPAASGWVDDYEPQEAQRELFELIVKAGRRCAYDLNHAAGALSMHDPRRADLYSGRSGMWLSIFNPANGPKDYRAELHRTISKQEREIERLKALCCKHRIDPEDPNSIPF